MDCTVSSCLTHHILIDPARSTKGGSVLGVKGCALCQAVQSEW
jgi:hypothetical protein